MSTLSPRLALAAAVLTLVAASGASASTVPGEVVVGYKGDPAAHVVHAEDVGAAIARLRARPDVRYAVRNAIAHTSAAYLPDDPGRGIKPGRWAAVQWNFAGPAGVNAPDAWGHLIAAGHPGGTGRQGRRPGHRRRLPRLRQDARLARPRRHALHRGL